MAQRNPSTPVMATGYMKLQSQPGEIYLIKALFDKGSEVNIMSEKLVRTLKIKKERLMIEINGIIGKHLVESGIVHSALYPWYSERLDNGIMTKFIVLKELPKPKKTSKIERIPDFEGLLLADPHYNKESTFHILLGVEFWANIIKNHVTHSSIGLCAQSTKFGYVIFGGVQMSEQQITKSIALKISVDGTKETIMNRLLARFWELNEQNESPYTVAEEQAERYFQETTTRDELGKFVVRIPFIENEKTLGDSRTMALKRFFQLERKLERNPEFREKYNKFMREFIELGHMRKANRAEKRANGYYIPHHAVEHNFRVVFDGSCVTTNGKSLNDIQLPGPNLQEQLAMIIMRFRFHRIVFSTDVRKMFRQFRMHEADLIYQKIFWRFSPNDPVCEYVIVTVVYGLKSSPFLAMRCMLELAKTYKNEYPLAARATELERYTDDYFSGADNEEDCVRLYEELCELLAKASLKLGKWKTNCPALVERIKNDQMDNSEMIDLSDEYASILGLKWVPKSDCFVFKVNVDIDKDIIITKRVVVSEVAKLYDPIGYLSPVIVTAKLFIQQLWCMKLDWDDPLSDQNVEIWKNFHQQLTQLNKIKIPRWLETTANRKIELIGFADASKKAYGATIYVRSFDNEQIHCNLLTSKSRVAPLKEQTIPRLELCAAKLLAELMSEVREKCKLTYARYFLFTDSTITLHWIKKESSNFKTFVAARISAIQKCTDVNSWSHITTDQNPADFLSRGLSVIELLNCNLWWHGPEFLRKRQDKWPILSSGAVDEKLLLAAGEYKISVLCANIGIETKEWLNRNGVPLIELYSTLNKVVRVTAYVRNILMRIREDSYRNTIGLSIDELNFALEYWIKYTQQLHFGKEIRAIRAHNNEIEKSDLNKLKPVLDKDGILRVWGRIENAPVSEDEKHPIIIPHNSHFARLLLYEAHLKTKHGNVQIMLHYVRAKYWITRSRRSALDIIKSCVRCVRFQQVDRQQLMADLPEERLSDVPPFTNCGVDYFGPIKLKRFEGRCNTIIQGYVAVFVCMSSKMIHLECCTDLTTEKFIWALTRFSSIYRLPVKMFSDNGRTFVGANNELRKILESWQSTEMRDYITANHMQWQFITPRAPNQGGLWEAAVKSTKYHAKRILGDQSFAYEKYQTLLAGISAILNSRPLIPLKDDPFDLNYLTPAHAHLGCRIIQPLTRNLSELSQSELKRTRAIDKIQRDFWNAFRKDYLNTLQSRCRWNTETDNVQIGDFVIIKEENLPPSSWSVARVIDAFPGNDNVVRNVRLKTATTELTRPVRKLVKLPIDPPK